MLKTKLGACNSNRKLFIVTLFLIFAMMLVLNMYTFYVADDYTYMNSFADDNKKINSVFEIFPSIYSHAFTMNGRLVAHFFVQLFLLFPSWIFDIVNAGVFVTLVFCLYKYFYRKNEINVLAVLGIFSALWYFIPAFGQTILWLDGACNYLWAVTFSLIYLYPYVSFLKDGTIEFKHIKFMNLYVVSGVLVGNYLETSSFCTILFAVSVCGTCRFILRRKVPGYLVWGTISMFAGFAVLMLSPGTLKNKVEPLGFSGYVSNFLEALKMYTEHLMVLMIVFIVLFTAALLQEYKNTAISALFFLMSLIANFLHITATYYPERSMLTSTIFLLLSIGMLLPEFADKYDIAAISCMGILFLYTLPQLFYGGYDVYSTYSQMMERNDLAIEEKRLGKTELELPLISVETKYSAQYGLQDISVGDNTFWYNKYLAKYYDVSSVIGCSE